MTQINKRRPATPKQAMLCCAPVDNLLKAEFFKGLSDRTRLKLLGCLCKCGRPCSVTEIAECCSVDFSVVSRHLALLERSGIVASAKHGRTMFYEVRYAEISEQLHALAEAVSACGPRSSKAACACAK
jgi:ArsR family transcriptional regulator, arsenate/arsenite/antimonite-responsive transcriptional repressor